MNPAFQKGRHDFYHLEGEILFDEVITFWDYTPEIEQLIFQVKYQRKKKLGLFLGQQLGKAFQTAYENWKQCIVMPVPLHRIRHRERGYNQSDILCQGINDCVNVPIYYDGLIRNRHTSTQTRLSAKERQDNVKNAFEVNPSYSFQGKDIVLVDDVITTGATVNNCAACLKEAGARKVIGIALARPQLD
ncbi:ComF family protein [bacterium]|nr:ComF family protein [bacterium]